MRQALTYIEIDIPVCANTYGVAPCTAALGVTGAIKCFNTRSTCQDIAHYNPTTVTLRFARNADYLPRSIECFPSISDISFTPHVVSLGEDLGQRATLEIRFTDHPDADVGPGFDPYIASRSYDPFTQGTFFAKLRARQPYLRGCELRWIQGYVGQALADMEVRNFIVDSFDAGADGVYTLFASDLLKVADDDRAQAPRLSTGYLSADITNSQTSATLLPSGIGNAEYPAFGYACIGGNEVVAFTRTGDSLALSRAQVGSTASAHKAQDRVQLVLAYSGQDVATIIRDLAVNYANANPAWISLSEWTAETAAFLGNVYTAYICEPTGVKTLISELVEQAALAVWPDDLAAKIRLQVLRAIATDAATFTPDNYCGGSLSLKEQPDKRISRVQIYFGQIDPTKPLDNTDNWRSSSLVVDSATETAFGSPAIKTIFARWIPALGRAIADRLGAIIVGRFKTPPRHVGWSIMRTQDDIAVASGIGCQVKGAFIQDATGAPALLPAQVTRLDPEADQIIAEAEEMLFTAPPVNPIIDTMIIDANINNVNLRAAHDAIYPPAVSGDTVNVTINAGVIVGSTSTSTPALDVGSWAAGVTINIVLLGRIEGAGGRGGDCSASPTVAGAGGPALYLRRAVNLDVSAGAIWGGGGGGGALSNICSGGGGAGQIPGAPGYSPSGYTGSPGTATAGGAGGNLAGIDFGGNGGGPGLAGGSGSGAGFTPYAPGAAGKAIDGVSYVSFTGSGDIRGPQVN